MDLLILDSKIFTTYASKYICMNNCVNISIWSITYQHYDEIINQSLNPCIILVGVARIYSIQGGIWSKGGEGIFSKSRGELAKRGS